MSRSPPSSNVTTAPEHLLHQGGTSLTFRSERLGCHCRVEVEPEEACQFVEAVPGREGWGGRRRRRRTVFFHPRRRVMGLIFKSIRQAVRNRRPTGWAANGNSSDSSLTSQAGGGVSFWSGGGVRGVHCGLDSLWVFNTPVSWS